MRLLALLAPAGTIALALVFMYANPYHTPDTPPLAASTIRIVYLALVLPAVAAAVAYFLRSRLLKWLAFFDSLPVGLYLGLAGIPSWWTGFILLIALYAWIPVDRRSSSNLEGPDDGKHA